jgi:D-alanyl-D-alanine carboxypeptidase
MSELAAVGAVAAGAAPVALPITEARQLDAVTLREMSVSWRAAMVRPALVSRPAAAIATASSGSSKLHVPPELRGYGNGRIPREALETIGIGQHRLATEAAQAFKAMRAAAAAEGIDVGVTDSYRPYDEQVDLVRRKGLYSQGGYAAVPGTSPHGWGMAIDVDVTPDGLAWLRANAGRFGFVENVPREPWHWEYHG